MIKTRSVLQDGFSFGYIAIDDLKDRLYRVKTSTRVSKPC